MWRSWSFIIILLWIAMALIAPLVSDLADRIQLETLLLSPFQHAPLGTDELGRPLWARLLAGAQTSAWVALMVVGISASVGTFIGMLSAYIGGWFDHVVRWIIDAFLAFPHLLLAIALAAVLGAGIGNLVLALSIVGWVGYARLARGQTLSLRNRYHVMAARSLAVPRYLILWRHVLPLLFAPLAIEMTFGIAGAVIAEAGLSFLGLGVQPPQASWGTMIREGARYILTAPHLVLVPGLTLMLVILAVNRFGDALRDKLDVRQ
ncbi:MAG: ABC transporter permease [Thiotrichales bacterium 32-46-8]|nr:MAG: ABC transporter permease [Thiotrichales bacterium 32-46-8]OYY24570.1 MAG: ABC transporter permease [Thiotrichales bacterium 35-46-9]OZA97751.1 MAG: ABC transporter permease [Thiotrichales bacterium 34-46-19]OZB87126.1 MAG: ABC transporter permease [Thiotrichales bacterium 12-47-6]HQR95560.1 ABC transporter permease [Thiotrichales bacterium]